MFEALTSYKSRVAGVVLMAGLGSLSLTGCGDQGPEAHPDYLANGSRIFTFKYDELDVLVVKQLCVGRDFVENNETDHNITRTSNSPYCADGKLTPADFE